MHEVIMALEKTIVEGNRQGASFLLGVFFLQSGLPEKVCLGPQVIIEVGLQKALEIASSGWRVHVRAGGGNHPSWNECQDGMGKGFLRQLTKKCDNVYEERVWMRDGSI